MERFLVLGQSPSRLSSPTIAKPRREREPSSNSQAWERTAAAQPRAGTAALPSSSAPVLSLLSTACSRKGSRKNCQKPSLLCSCACSSSCKEFQYKGLPLGLSGGCPSYRFLRPLETSFGVKNSSRSSSRSKKASGVYRITAGFKNKLKKAVKNLERQMESPGSLGELQGELPQLAISLPLGLASFEALFLVGWVSSLRGILPGAGFFSAGDLILCSVMFANCVVGWYALEHSRSEVAAELQQSHESFLWRVRAKAAQVGLWELGSSLALSFIPFANLFMWLRFAKRQEHLSARARAGIVANAWVYGGPPLFTILLLFSGGWTLWFQAGLVSNFALLMGALHRPFEEARVKNEKILLEVAKVKKDHIVDKKLRHAGSVQQKELEISAEEKARIEHMKELEEFDMLLAQSSKATSNALPEHPQEWSVGDTMQWLAQQGLARYAPTFADHNVDGALLLQLTGDDLRSELGIQNLGDRRKLQLCIKSLQDV